MRAFLLKNANTIGTLSMFLTFQSDHEFSLIRFVIELNVVGPGIGIIPFCQIAESLFFSFESRDSKL